MTAPHRDHPRGGEHVAEILPWYVNASLSREETALVDEHLATCAACRDELARCRVLPWPRGQRRRARKAGSRRLATSPGVLRGSRPASSTGSVRAGERFSTGFAPG
jgi:hypothetical protein